MIAFFSILPHYVQNTPLFNFCCCLLSGVFYIFIGGVMIFYWSLLVFHEAHQTNCGWNDFFSRISPQVLLHIHITYVFQQIFGWPCICCNFFLLSTTFHLLWQFQSVTWIFNSVETFSAIFRHICLRFLHLKCPHFVCVFPIKVQHQFCFVCRQLKIWTPVDVRRLCGITNRLGFQKW